MNMGKQYAAQNKKIHILGVSHEKNTSTLIAQSGEYDESKIMELAKGFHVMGFFIPQNYEAGMKGMLTVL